MPDHPNRIDRYEVQEVIGRGAMGVVYRALDPVIGRVVALKTISLSNGAADHAREDSLVRFAREARAAGLLSHPNIVTVYDVGNAPEGASSYIAMEFVEGRNLRQMVPHGESLPQEQVLDLAMQISRGLDYAHRRGIVHRDVKPANVLVREDGLVKLVDFGVARIDSSDLTRTGESVGSPSYIAPEMLLDQPTDSRSDLFSLGVVLYELLTGQKPFKGETIAALYHQVISMAPVPPSQRQADLAPDWDAIILKLLAKSPDKRYSTAAQVIEDLRRLELGKPLEFAMLPEATIPHLLLLDEPAPAALEKNDEAAVERVVELDAHDSTATRTGLPLPYTPQLKALLALLTVAGFALLVIVAAALLRHPSPGPVVAGAKAGPTAVNTVAAIDLTVRMAHNLKEGHLDVLMDGKPLLSESFHGERSRMRVQGALSRRLEIPPGRHVFKVSVRDEGDKTWNASSTRDVGTGAEATLFIELKGIVKRSLDLTWY